VRFALSCRIFDRRQTAHGWNCCGSGSGLREHHSAMIVCSARLHERRWRSDRRSVSARCSSANYTESA
jgi:hypothetical protein